MSKDKKSERLKVSPKNIDLLIKKAKKVIKEGGVVISPTDTVYGLICDAKNKKAVKKIFKIKKRKEKKPIPVFVKDLKMAKNLAILDKKQEKFLKRVWSTRQNFGKTWAGKGKITAVLLAKPRTKKMFPKFVVSPENKIGLRIPDYKIVNQLLATFNRPLAATSANISGEKESVKIKDVLEQFKNQKHQPDLILDAGNLKPSLPSTVIDLTNFKIKILREGGFSKRKISEILEKIKNEKK